MQKLCHKDGCGVCINCDNPDNLLCRNQVELIVEMLREIVKDYVLSEKSKHDICNYEGIDENELNMIMGI